MGKMVHSHYSNSLQFLIGGLWYSVPFGSILLVRLLELKVCLGFYFQASGVGRRLVLTLVKMEKEKLKKNH